MDKTFGELFAEFRKARNIAQWRLDMKLHRRVGYTARIEKNEKMPTEKTVVIIAKLLRLSDEELAALLQRLE